ncbi:MAG: hypothetical protein WB820_22220 [Rhodoplanes sp.]
MGDKPTEMQTLVLWALLGKGGQSFQKDIRPEIKRPDRLALEKAGFIVVGKLTRQGFPIEVTERGWAWAADHLGSDLPKRSTAGGSILQAWLTRLAAFMRAREVSLAEILGPQGAREDGSGRFAKPTTTPPDYDTLRDRIRQAYLEVTGGRLNTRALLTDLREKLNHIDRATLDEALKRMHLEEGTTLSGMNNPQEITPSIRDAGLSFKGEPMYVLWITK